MPRRSRTRWPATAPTSWRSSRRTCAPRWCASCPSRCGRAPPARAPARRLGGRPGPPRDRGVRRAPLPPARDGAVAAQPAGGQPRRGGSALRHHPGQLVADLELLFVCGTPGHLPDDLIEADCESGEVYLTNADAISRPLRLSVDEAVALLAGLRTLAQVPGLHDREALESALTKLSTAAGDAALAASALSASLGRGAEEHVLAAVRDGVRRHRRLHLRYLVPSRDETTERDVDPMRVLTVDDRWYLEGWCHRAEGVRLFRLDRI